MMNPRLLCLLHSSHASKIASLKASEQSRYEWEQLPDELGIHLMTWDSSVYYTGKRRKVNRSEQDGYSKELISHLGRLHLDEQYAHIVRHQRKKELLCEF